jgi:hypothetical protein
MARQKKTASLAGDRKLQAGALKALWKKVSVQQWHLLLSKADRDGQWTINGHSIKGRCPYHDDHSPSFVLNFDKGIGKCFGSCGKVVTDLINLYAKLSKQSYTAALTDISTQMDIADIIGPGVDELSEFNTQQEMKKAAATAMRKVIDEYVREQPPHLDYIKPALIYLVYGRKIPLNLLGSLPIGVFAKPEHLKKYIPEEYHAIFDAYFSKVDGRLYWGSVCFHYNDLPGSISRFKMRKMASDAQEICGNYASGKEMPEDVTRNLAEKSFYVVEDPFIKEMGVFGLHHYNRMIGASEANAYVTEGEFDALTVMAAQLAESRTDFMIFAFGGNGNSGLSFLRELGIRTIWVVQDAPVKHGDGVVRRLLLNPANFVGDSINKALSYRIFQWSPDLRGGDLDEAVNLMGYESLVQYLFTDRSSTFLNTYSWVLEQCDAEVSALKKDRDSQLALLGDNREDLTKRENIEITTRENIATTIKNWFRCLHDQLSKLTFVQRYSQNEGIDFSQLEEVNSSLYALDTPEGAAARIAEALREYIDIAYYDQTSSGPQFTIWSKQKHECVIVPFSEKQMDLIFSQYIGKDVTGWIKNLLAGSSLINKKSSGDLMVDRAKVQKTAASLLNDAYKLLIPGACSIREMVSVGQGIHYRDLKEAGNVDTVYFVNGEKVFKGRYKTGSGNPVEWEYVNSTVDGKFYFMLDSQKKWSVVDDEAELYSGTQIDLHALYKDLCKILDGWKFEEHELTRDYLAAWIMSLPIQRAINQVNMTFITGASTSGKTSFLRGLLGGTLNKVTFEVPSIIEGSWFTSDASPAGIYQEMNQSALALCLDEAEARQNTDHSARVSAFQELAYSIPFGGAKMSRGGSSAGMRTSYTLQMPVIMAAINMASNPTFLNRVVPIYTEKDINRKNIGTYIYENFSAEDIDRIRKSVTLCFLDKIPDLCSRLPALRALLAKQETTVKVNDRYITILLPALVVLDWLGFDAADMFKRIVHKNRNLIENLNSQDFHSDLLNAVLYTPGIRTTYDDNNNAITVSPKDCILDGDIATLNNSGVGVKLLQDRGWIVIFWRDVKYTLLKNSEFRYDDEASLRESVSKNKYLIHGLTRSDHRYIVKTLGRTDIKNATQYTVISAAYILDEQTLEDMKKRKPDDTGIKEHQAESIPIEAYEEEGAQARQTPSENVLGGDFSL